MFALNPPRSRAADSPKTFSMQQTLPRLPIPSLEQTFTRYLRSLVPILLQAEEMGQLPDGSTAQKELEKRWRWASEALGQGTLVRRLQQRLHDIDRTSKNNWLEDRFWAQKAYLEQRSSLLVNSNCWYMLRADPDTPAARLEDPTFKVVRSRSESSLDRTQALGPNTWEDSQWGIRRATWLIYRLLLFKQRLEAEDIAPDASRSGRFCMQPYRRFYGTTRIPGIPADTITEAAFPWQARHILVLARNNLYAMIVLNDDGQILALPDMERALTDIVNTARQADGVPVCILTAARRDDWARSREHLLSLSDTNRASLQTIEDSLFAVAMDSSVLNLPDEHASVSDSFTPESIDAQIRNISGVGRLGQNRWMDTSITIVVEPNGRAGCMAEHSPCDASTSAIVMEYASVEPAPRPCEPLAENLPGTAKISTNTTPAFARIEFDVDNQIMTSIDAAFAQVRSICDESDVGELWFDDYGMDWIRRVAKQPPDAYIQQMLQLVMYKVTGEQTATYESASTRKFLHGRTDVIRSFSRESYEFLRAVRENQPPSDIYRKLSAATLAHTQLIRAASRGHGIDRHLAALRWVYNRHEDGPVTPNTVENTTEASAGQRDPFYAGADLLFNDPLFEESQTWRLSSSSMQASDRVAGGGFGSGYVDGMGIGYYPTSNRLKFGIESKHAAPRGRGELGENPTRAIKRAIIDSLRYMRQVCEQGAPQDVEQARL